MKSIFLQQYEWILGSRNVLHAYIGTMSDEHFVTEVPGFGRGGSVRNLLVHIANTYEYWVGTHCFGDQIEYTAYSSIQNISDCIDLYKNVDKLVYELLDKFVNDYHTDIIRGTTAASAFKVFAHVTTHEFHHKGQLLTISRMLGYIPVDTDIIR